LEVAALKQSPPGAKDEKGMLRLQAGGRLNIRNASLKLLIEETFGVNNEMLYGLPGFAESSHWDILAKAPDVMVQDSDADRDDLLVMIKSLLARRFRLSCHWEEKPVSAFTMTTAKPKMKQADPSECTSCKEGPPTLSKVDPRTTNPVLGRLLSCSNVSMDYFAEQLQYLVKGYVRAPVLNSTGLEGGWDFTLGFSTADQFKGGVIADPNSTASDPNGAVSLPQAMEKQLGLKMQMRRRPIRVLVIDHLEEELVDN
jgi:uncharacterized protein (TIGR03435 family)